MMHALTDPSGQTVSDVDIRQFGQIDELARATCADLSWPAVALSCGSTYSSLFPYWVALRPRVGRTRFYAADERVVPFESPDSNWGTVTRMFLTPLDRGVDSSHFAVTRQAYEELLLNHFGSLPPVFDCVFLGVGRDGHTAGLFPGSRALADTTSTVLQTISPEPPADRLTLGPLVLATARRVVVVVAGANKGPVVEGILDSDQSLPIVSVLSRRKESIVYVESSLLR